MGRAFMLKIPHYDEWHFYSIFDQIATAYGKNDGVRFSTSVQRSRIKYAINRAFTRQFCDQYARYYTIEGSRLLCIKKLLFYLCRR